MKVYKLMTFANIIVIVFFWLFLNNMGKDPHACELGTMFKVCYIIVMGAKSSQGQLCSVVMMKNVGPKTRGTLLVFNALLTTVCYSIFTKITGSMWDDVSRESPFLIAFIVYILNALATFGFGIAGKL